MGFWSLFLNSAEIPRSTQETEISVALYLSSKREAKTQTVLPYVECSLLNSPKYLRSDHDPLFTYHQWAANLRILDIDEVKSIPYTPCSHPFIERLIGTVRRDFPDQTLF